MDDMINDPGSAKMVAEAQAQGGKSILYGLIEMVMKRVDSYSPQSLYNVMAYFNRYNELEPLSWLYKDILVRYPEFRFGGTANTPDDELKHKAALMVTAGAKSKGLQ